MTTKEQRNCKPPVIAKDEQGYILVMALLMLVVLSLMGTAAMTVRNTEVSIATNAEIIQHNFYALEGVTLEGTTKFETSDVEKFLADFFGSILVDWTDSKILWLNRNDPVIDLSKNSEWSSVSPKNTEKFKPKDGILDANARIQYAAHLGNLHSDPNDPELCRGSDRSDPTKREGCFSVYGMYDVKSGAGKAYSGRRMLMVGYKKTIYLNP